MPTYQLPVRGDTKAVAETLRPGLDSRRRYTLAVERGAGAVLTPVEIGGDDVVALELEGGFTLWMRGDDLDAELGTAAPARGGDAGLRELLPGLPLVQAERGAGAWLLKALEVFGIKPQEALVAKAAAAVERHNGDLLLKRDEAAAGRWTPVEGIAAPADGAPVLLLIHGTFSSTAGSFGDLFADPANLSRLRRCYGDRIYGFEHRTLSEGPVENLRALLRYLPHGVRLHLVSHSRGGLVGDLLALAASGDGRSAFSDEDLRLFDDPASAAGPAQDQRPGDQLAELGRALGALQVRVERFVRVASPSRGTTLAAGRLDRWLSVLATLAGYAPGAVGTLAEGFLDLVLAVVKERTNPHSLPGLAAMTPGSPLVRLLNRSETPVPGSLAVIAGDLEPQGIWDKVRLLIPDLFFAGEHDLVVNTGSMYGGPAYRERCYFFDQGPAVDHFSYFKRKTTADRVLDALARPHPLPGFRPIVPEMATEPARGARGGSVNRPVLVVLPGIMGSTLSVAGQRLWVNVVALARGGLARLRLDGDRPVPTPVQTPVQNPVQADGLVALAYADLLVYFDQSHEVLAFPYDWRLSIEESARQLAVQIEHKLTQAEAYGQPVRILAHSMGGLVARAMIAARPDLWARLRRHPGGRLVMLGTPNGGSWEIVRLLVARAATLKQLALLDRTQGRAALLAIINEFPGVLELLPEDARNLFAPATWSALHAQDEVGRDDWAPPGRHRDEPTGATRLERAGALRARLRASAVDATGMIYVAGQAATTPCGIETVEERRLPGGPARKTLRLLASARGDGMVLWEDGTLPGVPTWYAAGVAHGDLANRRALFPVLGELLAQGRTSDLPDRPPVARGVSAPVSLPEREPAYLPDAHALLTSALGMGPPQLPVAAQPKVQVSVIHGNLAFANHTVAVGHYAGDTIIAAEAYLDRVLGGRLRARLDLGLYPGASQTFEVFTNPDPQGKPTGALVVGLGRVGDLTPSTLATTFAHAVLGFCRTVLERPVGAGEAERSGALAVSLSSVLIGTGAGGLGIEEALRSLARGVVRANALLEETGQARAVRIAELELVEIWEDQAVRAAHALAQLEQEPELAGQLAWRPTVRRGVGGYGGLRPNADPEWWHRLQILTSATGSLRFTSLTQRARAEESLLALQRAFVDRFVEQAVGSTARGTSTARTLFEMLVPNRLKDGNEFRSNLVLVVDEHSARFPWELLEDRWSDGGGPPAVEHGLIRQLATGVFRERQTMAVRGRALVVGDPRSDRTPLPGARREAQAVREALIAMGLMVTAEIQSDMQSILTALHAHAYQILHLAGHGVHQEPLAAARRCPACRRGLPPDEDERESGMIVGPGMVLTPADVDQMRQVPELVFINCCHLGATEPGAESGSAADSGRGSGPRNLNVLAANLAVQFIGMGVRAVIAAGWAVDDAAGEAFAKAFYRHLGSGLPFGAAVRLAREEVWQDFAGVNTWGAYQCYGDPDFRIVRQPGGAGIAAEPPGYVSVLEAVADLTNLQADALTASRDDLADLRRRLATIEARLDRAEAAAGEGWRSRGDLLEALGRVHGELGLYQTAVDLLGRALRAEEAAATQQVIDARARFHARWAKDLQASGDTQGALRELQAALDALESMTPPGERGALSQERCRSLTGIHSRRVQLLAPPQRAQELERLIEVYERYAEGQPDPVEDPLTPYSRLLWLTAKFLLTGYRKATLAEVCPDFDARCADLERRICTDRRDQRGIWNDTISRELQLLRALHGENLTSEGEAVLVGLLRALNRGVSGRQFSSIVNNLDLLRTLCAEATVNRQVFAQRAETINEVRRRFLERAGPQPP